ncbi:hypothetical protein [Cryptosporidium hominis TU502]|uniref:hypothetical protein n=1 Tax=Cryptosporidium hominis (strain TU502) TaxID=353151 RepID=UPI0000452D85|nr:hypothetical protein [Cryptosporidium hominis TU502]
MSTLMPTLHILTNYANSFIYYIFSYKMIIFIIAAHFPPKLHDLNKQNIELENSKDAEYRRKFGNSVFMSIIYP